MAQPAHNALPTYEESTHGQPAGRFGRWQGWVEKRGHERLELRATEPTRLRGWFMEGDSNPAPPTSAPRVYEPERLNVSTLDSAEARLRQKATRAVNDAAPSVSRVSSSSSSSPIVRSASTTALTASGLSVHSILERFDAQLPEKPLCASVLRTAIHLYVLIGAKTGLFCVDLTAMAPTRERTTLESAKWFRIWTSGAIHCLEVVQQETGALLTLISSDDDKHIRIFPLQVISNLCRYQSSSTAVELKLPSFGKGTESGLSKKETKRASGFLKRAVSRSSHHGDEDVRSDSEEGGFVLVQGRREPSITDAWLASSVPLKLPAAHPPISSIDLLDSPFGDDDTTVYMAVITRTCIYLFEAPLDKRSFSLAKELYTPQPARSLSLVLVSRDKKNKSAIPVGELALFAGFSDKAVLIHLSDTSVAELELPSDSSTSASTRSLLGRARARSRSNSLISDHSGSSISRLRRHSLTGRSRSATESVESLKEVLGLGSSKFWSCTSVTHDNSTLYLLSRDKATFAVRAPFLEPAADSPRNTTKDFRRGLAVEPCHEWRWKNSLASLLPCLNTDNARTVLVLTAVTASGFEVQEGLFNLAAVPPRPIFLPLRSSEDLDSSAQYDFNSPVGHLTSFDPFAAAPMRLHRNDSVSSGGQASDAVREPARGCLLWVQGLNEYQLRYVG